MRNPMNRFLRLFVTATAATLSISVSPPALAKQQRPLVSPVDEADSNDSELRAPIERFTVDRGSLLRSFPVTFSAMRTKRLEQFYTEWLAVLGKLNFESLSLNGKVDYLLLRNHLQHELRQLS